MQGGPINDVRDLQAVPGVETSICSAPCDGNDGVSGVIGTCVGVDMNIGILEEADAELTTL